MSRKERASSNDPIRQAELILKLYELRREAVTREARAFVGGQFKPRSAAELVEIVSAGGKEGAFVLQVYGYWDMVAAFVASGALDEALVYATCQEMYFQYAKIQPYLKKFRKKMKIPEFLVSIERVVDGSEMSRGRLQSMRNSLAAMAEARSAPA